MSEETKKIKKTLANTPAEKWGVKERLKVLQALETLMAKVPVEQVPGVAGALIEDLHERREKAFAIIDSIKMQGVSAYIPHPLDRQVDIEERINKVDPSTAARNSLVKDAEAGKLT